MVRHTKTYLLIVLLLTVLKLIGQNNFELITATNNHEYYSNLKSTPDMKIACTLRTMDWDKIFYLQTNKMLDISLNDPSDTINWNLNLWRQDTSFLVGDLVFDQNQNCYIIGTAFNYFSEDSLISSLDWIMKLDNNKNLIWEQLYKRPSGFEHLKYGMLTELLVMDNNRLLALGSIRNPKNPGEENMYLIQFNSSGDTIKTKLVNRSIGKIIQAVTYNYDSSELILHKTLGTVPGKCHQLIGYNDGALSVDTTNFDTLNFKCYYEPQYDALLQLNIDAKLSSTGYLYVAGLSNYSYNNGYHLSVFKYDSSFNLISHVKLTPPDTIIYPGWYQCLDINENGEVFVTGAYDQAIGSFPEYYCYVYIAKLDTNLNLINEKYYGGDASYNVYSLTATQDGGVAVGGYKYDYQVNNNHEGDAFIFKTDGNLTVGLNENNIAPFHSVLIFPNPSKNYFNIRTTSNNSQFVLFDEYGRQILSEHIYNLNTEINTCKVSSGIYFWKLIKNETLVDKGKWIKN